MIRCIVGTRAQLVKMAPVILEIERRGWRLDLIFTGQHKQTMSEMVEDFGIRTKGAWLYDGPEVTGIGQVPLWYYECLRSFSRLSATRSDPDVYLVHGDTFSTILGAHLGRKRRAAVAHVESGLRSFRLFSPFPEELTRLGVFSLANIAFCPGEWAMSNLQKYRLEAVNTFHNTLLDTLNLIIERQQAREPREQNYALCSIHRFENVFFRRRLARVIELIRYAADTLPVRFVLHPVTKRKLTQYRLLERLEQHPNIALMDRMKYSDFVLLMRNSRGVITDGGSNQEELSYLRIPTFIMRSVTERQEGLGDTAVIGKHSFAAMKSFLDSLGRSREPAMTLGESPSKIIADRLAPFAASNGA